MGWTERKEGTGGMQRIRLTQLPQPGRTMARAGLVASLTGSLLLFGACTRPGSGSGGEATATTAATPTRTVSATRATRTATTSGSAGATTTTAPLATTSASPPSGASTVPAAVPTATTGTTRAPAAPTGTPVVQGQRYVVESGDTLGSIASQFGVTVDEIISANRIENPDLIRVGQELIIPER